MAAFCGCREFACGLCHPSIHRAVGEMRWAILPRKTFLPQSQSCHQRYLAGCSVVRSQRSWREGKLKLFEELARHGFTQLRQDHHYPALLAWLARVCLFLRDVPRPPGGRLSAAVLQALARLFQRPADELRTVLFPPRR